MVGGDHPIADAALKVTGDLEYATDMELPGMLHAKLVEHPGDDGPFGAKSVGEIATVPTAPAIVNAVNRALGTALTRLPLTPDRVLAARA